MPQAMRRFLGIAVARWRALGIFLLARMSEPGTIRQGVVACAALIGVRIAPERADAIGWIGLALAIAIGILTREDRSDPPPPPPPEGQA